MYADFCVCGFHTFKGAYGDWIFVLPAAFNNYSVTSLGPCNYYQGQDLDIPMAATEDNSIILRLDDEVEGERRGSDDYCFIGIGEAVPIKPGDDAEFNPQNPPSKPLSVSERFGLIFVSHSTGTSSPSLSFPPLSNNNHFISVILGILSCSISWPLIPMISTNRYLCVT